MNNPWGLRPRQVECLRLLIGEARGCNKRIAKMLGIQVTVVEYHLSRAFHRMKVENRIQAAIAWDRFEPSRLIETRREG